MARGQHLLRNEYLMLLMLLILLHGTCSISSAT